MYIMNLNVFEVNKQALEAGEEKGRVLVFVVATEKIK